MPLKGKSARLLPSHYDPQGNAIEHTPCCADGLLLLGTMRGSPASMSQLPGAEALPVALQERLARALREKGTPYKLRTRHLRPDGSLQYTNRLILEPSPYLLQHAHNPVNWYPWGDDAFAQAKEENKPVLLSVGYSTCHWCHVMEEESFEDPEREQRPDIDGIYVTAVHMLTGSGGWPMNVWLTPERKPFFAGTYFPPRDGMRGVRLGFLTLLKRLHETYHQEPERVATAAAEITQRIQTALTPDTGEALPGVAVLTAAAQSLRNSFDPQHGGFRQAPKFPRSVELEFLLRYSRRTGDQPLRAMVIETLEAMAAGGIYDHIGGCAHRREGFIRPAMPTARGRKGNFLSGLEQKSNRCLDLSKSSFSKFSFSTPIMG